MIEEGAATIRVLVIDDHEVVRQGVVGVIASHGDIVVCGEATTAEEGILAADDLRPDVVVMDVRLHGMSGIEATREIRARHPRIAVIMLTSFADDDALFASLMAGASGYLLKRIRLEELVTAIRHVASGRSLLDPAVTTRVLDELRRDDLSPHRDERLERLSPREHGVLDLVAEGLTNREIAERLFIAEKTVKNHVSSILTKLELVRRAQAAAYVAGAARSFS